MENINTFIKKYAEKEFGNQYHLIDIHKMKLINEEYLVDNIIKVNPALEFFYRLRIHNI